MVLQCELVSIFVVLCWGNIMDTVMNFIALAIIADFDDFVFGALRCEEFKQLLDVENYKQILTISFTTSKNCPGGPNGELSDLVDEETGKFFPMRIRFWEDRSFTNKVAFVVYKIWRLIYVNIYFYYFPFAVLLLTFSLPYMGLMKHEDDGDFIDPPGEE